MGWKCIAGSVLGLAGCAQIWGIDPTSAPDSVPLPPMASLSFERLSIGAAIVRAPLDLTGQPATYLIADPAEPNGFRRLPATVTNARDGWTVELPEGIAASVEFILPDAVPFRRLYTFPNRTLLGLFGVYEHPGIQPAASGAALSVQLTLPGLYAAGELIRLYAVGTWAYHDFAGGTDVAIGAGTLGPLTVPYDTMRWPPIAVVRPLQQITTADRVVALRYLNSDLTGAGEIPAFDQTSGTDAVMATMTTVTHEALSVQLQPTAVATRLNMTSPAGATLSMSWSVVAAPAWQYGNNTGPVLQSGAVAMADSGAITAMYGNPFVGNGWRSLFTWAASKSRSYTVAAAMLPVTLYAGLNQYDEPSAGLTLDQPAGLPVLVSINKMPLTSDGLTAMLDPTKPVELSLVADRTANTFYQFNVYELVPNTAMPPTALDYKIAYAAFGPTPEITIPHDVFVAGKVYTVRAHCIRGGYPTIAEGNLQNRALPYSIGYLDSGVFTVAAP